MSARASAAIIREGLKMSKRLPSRSFECTHCSNPLHWSIHYEKLECPKCRAQYKYSLIEYTGKPYIFSSVTIFFIGLFLSVIFNNFGVLAFSAGLWIMLHTIICILRGKFLVAHEIMDRVKKPLRFWLLVSFYFMCALGMLVIAVFKCKSGWEF
jgi:hypothetical protein